MAALSLLIMLDVPIGYPLHQIHRNDIVVDTNDIVIGRDTQNRASPEDWLAW
jgi:hypothetical protein